MKTKIYRTIDKSNWPNGPWKLEPDKIQWEDRNTKLPCLMVRNQVGAWCGYVGVSPMHPYYEKDYSEIDVNVHGGLTFSNKCDKKALECESICHVPGAYESDDVWWIGFDCSHAGDVIPNLNGKPLSMFRDCEYRDFRYVMCEVTSLADQLSQINHDRTA